MFYTPAELASEWKLAETVITRYLRTGKLQGVKFGNKWRVSESAKLAFESAGTEAEPRSRPEKHRKTRDVVYIHP